MNLLNIFGLLSEAREIENINKTIGGRVPQNVMNYLSSRVKKGKYDNIAMAIFKEMQESDDEAKKKFIEDHISLVYGVMRELRTNNSQFNPDKIVGQFFSDYKGNNLMEYWKKLYSERGSGKQEKKEVYGLKNAKITNLPQSIVIFPRTFKKEGKTGLTTNDIIKQHEDIRKLSYDMAKLDTSGVEGAKENHWCVAASEGDGTYAEYKEYDGPGMFAVIVNKKNGKVDWNDRYLLWFNTMDNEDGDSKKRYELADKLNDHYKLEDGVLPRSTVAFIEKLMDRFKGGSVALDYEMTQKVRRKASEIDPIDDDTQEGRNFRKILDLIYRESEKAAKSEEIYRDTDRCLKAARELVKGRTLNGIKLYMLKNGDDNSREDLQRYTVNMGDDVRIDLIIRRINPYAAGSAFVYSMVFYDTKTDKRIAELGGLHNAKEFAELLRNALKDRKNFTYSANVGDYEKSQEDLVNSDYDKARYNIPSHKMSEKTLRDLHYNKKLIDMLSKLRKGVTYIGSSVKIGRDFAIGANEDNTRYIIKKKLPHEPHKLYVRGGDYKTLGYLDDKDIVDKVKKEL